MRYVPPPSASTTTPVMSLEPNQLGLFDLGGNAWKWCEDWLSSDKTSREFRGGSWFDTTTIALRSSPCTTPTTYPRAEMLTSVSELSSISRCQLHD
ncbi:MAG: SUMF1/EgtB/PvdO family nonheme iron enzyme [Verrucomicrobiales bacterium]